MKERKERLWLWIAAVIMLVSAVGCVKESPIITVGDQTVSEQQAQLYLALTVQEYEQRAGQQIWDMRLGGKSAYDAACEAALASLIRNKTVYGRLQSAQKTLTQEEEELIDRAVGILYDRIGSETMAAWEMERETVREYVKEDYCVSKFISQMAYAPDMEEVERRVEEYFVWYDNIDVTEYMQKIWLDAIVIYSGQWLDGNWVPYSEEEKQKQYNKAQEAMDRLEAGETFEEVREKYTEEDLTQMALPFREGLVCFGEGNIFYKGQLERDLWEAMFRVPIGQISTVLESEYGYLIVKVLGFPQASDKDQDVYQEKLGAVREEYRLRMVEELTREGIETIINEWRDGQPVSVDTRRWQRIVDAVGVWMKE